MTNLLLTLQKDHPKLTFTPGEAFCWSPKTQTITFSQEKASPAAEWALLHEVSHAILGHQAYSSDLELISLESQAWAQAKKLGEQYSYQIDEDHIEDCMDTYREWLFLRSTCPVCQTHCLQKDARTYHCHNCDQVWKVTASRFCRPYRRKQPRNQKSPQARSTEATFV